MRCEWNSLLPIGLACSALVYVDSPVPSLHFDTSRTFVQAQLLFAFSSRCLQTQFSFEERSFHGSVEQKAFALLLRFSWLSPLPIRPVLAWRDCDIFTRSNERQCTLLAQLTKLGSSKG